MLKKRLLKILTAPAFLPESEKTQITVVFIKKLVLVASAKLYKV